THFLRCLKSTLVADGTMVADENWARVIDLRFRVSEEHRRLSEAFRPQKNPEMIYALVYQDGLMHACDWLTAQATAGKASHKCYVVSTARHYEKLRGEYLAGKRYVDVAYIEGFLNGLIFGIATKKERRRIPLFFLFGTDEDLTSLSKYR